MAQKFHFRRACLILIFLLTLSSICVINGCAGNLYATFKFPENDFRFSSRTSLIYRHSLFTFEYPKSFIYVDYNLIDTIRLDITKLEFNRFRKDMRYLSPSNITILVNAPGFQKNVIDVNSAIDYIKAKHQNDANFKIIEEGYKTISGNKAKYISFLYYDTIDASLNFPLYDRIERFSCFELDGLLWKLEMQTFKEEDGEMAPYYQHLIDTL